MLTEKMVCINAWGDGEDWANDFCSTALKGNQYHYLADYEGSTEGCDGGINVMVPVEYLKDWQDAAEDMGITIEQEEAYSVTADSEIDSEGYSDNSGPRLWFLPVDGRLFVTTEKPAEFPTD